ncbi:MAG TPA: DinB family protein [Methylomirabilota bacterium]|nr:DinB family protein [Methylomirabilota bacterium]
MALTPTERRTLIDRYAAGPARLRAAIAAVPADALTWRPAPREWSAHEVAVHCADSETQAASRIRFLAAEPDPLVLGYDEANWAEAFDYHAHPLELALATVDAVRANTVALLRRLPEEAWMRVGRHTQSGRYTSEDWLQIYAAHLEDHSRQIEANVAAWRKR